MIMCMTVNWLHKQRACGVPGQSAASCLASILRGRRRYASPAWSRQYGFPTKAGSVQKWKPGVPGLPMGQQQVSVLTAGVAVAVRSLWKVGADGMAGGTIGAGAAATGSGTSDGLATATMGMMSTSRGTGSRRGGRDGWLPEHRMGDGRCGRSRRWALPTTAFFETPRRRPISAVE